MSVTSARFIAPARREFLTEVVYYNDKEPGLGARFAAAVEEAAARAVAFPTAGSQTVGDTRRVFVRDFPFSLVYRADKNGIVIFALAHHSRRPEYWRPRVQEI